MKTFEKLFMWEDGISLYARFQNHFTEKKIKNQYFVWQILKSTFRISSTMARWYEINIANVQDYLQKAKGYVGDVKTLIYIWQQLDYFTEEEVIELVWKCSKIAAWLYKFMAAKNSKIAEQKQS